MLNPQLLDQAGKRQRIWIAEGTQWQDVQGKILEFEDGRAPSQAACGLHTLLALQHAQRLQWLSELQQQEESANAGRQGRYRLSDEDIDLDDAAARASGSPNAKTEGFQAFLSCARELAASAWSVSDGVCNEQEEETHEHHVAVAGV